MSFIVLSLLEFLLFLSEFTPCPCFQVITLLETVWALPRCLPPSCLFIRFSTTCIPIRSISSYYNVLWGVFVRLYDRSTKSVFLAQNFLLWVFSWCFLLYFELITSFVKTCQSEGLYEVPLQGFISEGQAGSNQSKETQEKNWSEVKNRS